MKKKLSLVLSLAMVLSLLASCSTSDSSSSTSSTNSTTSTTTNTTASESNSSDTAVDLSTAPDGVVAGTVSTMYVNADCVTQQLPGQYTNGQWIYAMMYDTLFWSPSGMYDDMEGLLVETYEVSDDQLTWVLNLHEDVYFNNGKNLTAQSVLDSFQYHIDINNDVQLSDVSTYEATGEYQVTMILNNPDPEFMTKMAVANFAIFDTTLYKEYGANVDAAYMSGSGPYYISDYGVGDYITFTASPDHWNSERQAHIETIDCKVILDANSQATALASGALDYGAVTDYVLYETLSGYDDLTLISMPETIAYRPVWLNSSTESGYTDMLNNVRVREALCMMVDTEQVALAYGGGYGANGNNAFSSYVDYDHSRVYDPEGGLAILEEEGIDPADIVLTGITSTATSAIFINLQAQLGDCGVTLNFTLQDDPAVISAMRAGEWDLFSNNGGMTSLAFNAPIANTLGSGANAIYVPDADVRSYVAGYADAAQVATSEEAKMDALAELARVLDEEYLYIASVNACSWYSFSENIINPVIDYNMMGWRPWNSWVA